jgi:hypothetical protein
LIVSCSNLRSFDNPYSRVTRETYLANEDRDSILRFTLHE